MNTIINSFGFFAHQPNPFTANVTGYLKSKGLQVKNVDINLIIWEHLLSKEFLETLEYRPEIFKKNPFFLTPNISLREFEILKVSVLEEVERAVQIYRSKEEFYDVDKLNWATYVQLKVQQLIYYHYGAFINNKVIFWPKIAFHVKSLNDIYFFASSTENNPLLNIYERKIIPLLKELNPKIVGVEIMFPWEIIGVLALNTLIKKYLPDTHITYLGHGFDEVNFTRLKDKMSTNRKFFFGFDSIFMARNNESILELFRNEKIDYQSVKSIKSLASYSETEITVNAPFSEGKIDFEVFPDYSDLDLKRYFTPNLVLFDKLSTKCFWSQCSYCSINSYKEEQQIANLDLFVNRIEGYIHEYNCRHVWLIDEATPPNIIEKFSDKLMERKVPVIWSVRTRVDSALNFDLLKKMHLAGCRELWVGLEAVSPRILRLMNKTKYPNDYAKEATLLMQHCNEIGIGIHFCILMGFPSETDGERNQVVNFFRNNKPFYKNLPLFTTFNEFMLMKDSPMYFNPEKFGIIKIEEDAGNYDMVAIPFNLNINFKKNIKNFYQKKTEKTSKKLTSIIVSNKVLLLLWFYVTDTCQELLLKEKFQKGNPFQKKPTVKSLTLLLLTIFFDKSPIFSKYVRNVQRKYAGIELQSFYKY